MTHTYRVARRLTRVEEAFSKAYCYSNMTRASIYHRFKHVAAELSEIEEWDELHDEYITIRGLVLSLHK